MLALLVIIGPSVCGDVERIFGRRHRRCRRPRWESIKMCVFVTYYRWLKRWILSVILYFCGNVCVCSIGAKQLSPHTPKHISIELSHTTQPCQAIFRHSNSVLYLFLLLFLSTSGRSALVLVEFESKCVRYWKSVELKEAKWNHWYWRLHFDINGLRWIYWQFCCVWVCVCCVSMRKIWCNIRKVWLKLTHKQSAFRSGWTREQRACMCVTPNCEY